MHTRSIRLPMITALLLALGFTLALEFALLPRHAGATPPSGSQGFTAQARLGFTAGDDWEPAIAADRYGHVYTLYKHYDLTGQTSCSSCDLHLLLQVSDDRGMTWSQPHAIDPEVVQGGQYDAQIAVDPVDGRTVWAAFLQKSKASIAVMKSTDFGQTWSGPTIIENLQRATDKDVLTVHGATVVVAYNAVQKVYAAISHDAGQTWSNTLIS
ncbi:MAG: sialidase family protein, partial [Ktedonobacterales bacterium]